MNPLKPEASLLCKLGSLLVHTEEGLSDKGHAFDIMAIRNLANDPEVQEWRKAMDKLALLPVKR